MLDSADLEDWPTPGTCDKKSWPPDYISVFGWRQQQLAKLRANPELWAGAKGFYKRNPVAFINHWCDTYDPRNVGTALPARLPFVLFPRQEELIEFLKSCIENQTNGLTEKARDMGATWVCCAFSVWMWLFWDGSSVGWGSRKEQLVDRIGDPDSLFEKMRMLIRYLPPEFLPVGFREKEHMTYMRIVNPQTGSTITGEAGTNIGRGGRKLIYFKDESAHYDHPEKIEASLGDNTNVQIDISSVNGLGNVFHRKRESGIEWVPGAVASPLRVNVFVMDWRDHPAKTDEWYLRRKAKAEAEGLSRNFAQEVDRNYAASVEGIIIKPEWVVAAIDADKKLPHLDFGGANVGGLDVADGGGDLNALALRTGLVLNFAEDFGAPDTGTVARRAIGKCSTLRGGVELQYDCIGVGAGIKSEANRLEALDEMPVGVTLVPWSAAASPQNKEDPIYAVEHDPASAHIEVEPPKWKDFCMNLKAQAWWLLARRFEKTYRVVEEGAEYPVEELISISSDIEKLQQLKKELSQATMSRSTGALKLVVNKTPEGTRSPNMADAVVMAYSPIEAPEAFVWSVNGRTV